MIENIYAKVKSKDGWESRKGLLKKGAILKVNTILASPYSSAFQADGFGIEFFPENPFDFLCVKVGSEVFYDQEHPLAIEDLIIKRGMRFKIIELIHNVDSNSIRIKIDVTQKLWFNLNDFRILS